MVPADPYLNTQDWLEKEKERVQLESDKPDRFFFCSLQRLFLLPAKTSSVWQLVVKRMKRKKSLKSNRKVPITSVTVTLLG